jgi:hypothetical protein
VCRSLKLPKPEEPKWIVVVRSRRTHVNRLCTLGGSTLGGSKCGEFETLEAQRAEVNHSHRSVGGHVSIDRELKAEVPKWTRAVDLRWMRGA